MFGRKLKKNMVKNVLIWSVSFFLFAYLSRKKGSFLIDYNIK